MSNKRNKLQIKENWDKDLTISSAQMNRLKGGTNADASVPGASFCPNCEDCNPGNNDETHEKPTTDPDPNTK